MAGAEYCAGIRFLTEIQILQGVTPIKINCVLSCRFCIIGLPTEPVTYCNPAVAEPVGIPGEPTHAESGLLLWERSHIADAELLSILDASPVYRAITKFSVIVRLVDQLPFVPLTWILAIPSARKLAAPPARFRQGGITLRGCGIQKSSNWHNSTPIPCELI